MKKIMIETTEASNDPNARSTSEVKEVADDWTLDRSEEGTVFTEKHITDYNYFAMVDNQVRIEFALCEEYSIKPLIEKIYEDNDISTKSKDLVKYPVEGYYYKTPGLRKYFQLIRNLQENPEVYNKVNLKSKDVEEVIWFLGNNIWGTVSSDRSETPFPRMKDIMTNTVNALKYKPAWTIKNIMAKIDELATGNANLVELAHLTGDVRCLTAGCETNALYREMGFCMSGCLVMQVDYKYPKKVHVSYWDIKDEIQDMGPKLIDKYNEVVARFQEEKEDPHAIYSAFGSGRKFALNLKAPDLLNMGSLTMGLEMPRVAMLGQCLDDREYYHWILDKNEVTEKWDKGVITTDTYTQGKPSIKFDDWDMSGAEIKTGKNKGKTNLNTIWGTDDPLIEGLSMYAPPTLKK